MHLKYGKIMLFILLSVLPTHQVLATRPTTAEILDTISIVGGLGIAGVCIYSLYPAPETQPLASSDIAAFTGIALYSAFVAGHTIYKKYFDQPSCQTCTTRQSQQKR